jgi:hypothetical protein
MPKKLLSIIQCLPTQKHASLPPTTLLFPIDNLPIPILRRGLNLLQDLEIIGSRAAGRDFLFFLFKVFFALNGL